MAGGQGTRLGCNYPKGQYDIELISHKPLFQLQAERIRRIEEMASTYSGKSYFVCCLSFVECLIPWYIMTSPMTHSDTLSYILSAGWCSFLYSELFNQQQFFGLDPNQIVFFSQGTLPCMDNNGHIIMSSPSQVVDWIHDLLDCHGTWWKWRFLHGSLQESINNQQCWDYRDECDWSLDEKRCQVCSNLWCRQCNCSCIQVILNTYE